MKTARKPATPWALLSGVLCALSVGACGPPLPTPADLLFDRPLGARIEVVGEPGRATPRPGERARYRVVVAYTDPSSSDDELRSMFLVCTAPGNFTGVPVCQEFLDGAFSPEGMVEDMGASTDGPGGLPGLDELPCEADFDMALGPFALSCVGGTPAFEFEVESGFSADAKFVLGVVCQRGDPVFAPGEDGQFFRCRERPGESLGEVMPLFGTVPVSQGSDTDNANPDLGLMQVELERFAVPDPPRGAPATVGPWEALPEGTAFDSERDCAGLPLTDAQLPRVSLAAPAPPMLRLRYPIGALERVPADDGSGETVEGLLLNPHATLVGLQGYDRLFRAVDDGADTADGLDEAEIEFIPDEDADVDPRGLLVRFSFTARDGRGGFDLVERALCLLP